MKNSKNYDHFQWELIWKFNRNKSSDNFVSHQKIKPEWNYLHLEGETHFRLHGAREDLEHQLNKVLFVDAALEGIPGCQSEEPVADDTRQIDVLDKGDLIDWLQFIAVVVRRLGAQSQVHEYSLEVGP